MPQLSKTTVAMLEDIERRIDPEIELDFSNQWRGFLKNEFKGTIFCPKRAKVTQPSFAYPRVYINDAIEDYDLMLQSELCALSYSISNASRTAGVWIGGYGTGTLSSVLGAEIFMVPKEMNTPPTTHVVGSDDRIREIVSRGVPSLDGGFGKRVFECGEFFAETFAKYPKISACVNMFHPDLQGPLDIAELLWGGDMFYAMYDEPELVHSLLSVITETFTSFMKRWETIFPLHPEINCYKFYHYLGGILLRCDSAMNLSPDLYREFAVPYDTKLYDRFGGGAMHFCGRGDHYIEALSEVPGLTGVNLAQAQYNNMETIYKHTVDKGIKILMLDRGCALRDQNRPGGYHHCLSTWYE